MNKEARRRVYASRRWKALRRRYAEATGEACERCGGYAPLRKDGAARGDLDHITGLADGGAAFDARNLQWLCIRCHAKKTNPCKYPMPEDWKELLEGA